MTAVLAGACKTELAFTAGAAGGLFHGAAQLLRYRDLGKIGDTEALCADAVDMGQGVAVEALDATHCAEALDQTLLLEQRQIPVNRGQ